MRLQVTVRRGHVNDGVRSYVESKFAKLGRRLHESTLVDGLQQLRLGYVQMAGAAGGAGGGFGGDAENVLECGHGDLNLFFPNPLLRAIPVAVSLLR